VHDALFVRRLEDFEKLVRNSERLADRNRRFRRCVKGFDRHALEELHDDERRARFVDVVVENDDGARVIHGIGKVTLTHEAASNVPAHREFGMKHFDGKTLSVAMRRRIDGRHASDAEDSLDAIFAVENDSHAPCGTRVDLLFLRHGYEVCLPPKSSGENDDFSGAAKPSDIGDTPRNDTMRLDVAITTDTVAGPNPAAGDVTELSIVWLSPDSARPPFSLDWKDDEQRAVGRDETCAVCLSGPDVSRRHAVLQRSGPGTELSILDLESRNGTRVNGRVVRTARLERGDVVRFGGWVGVVAAGFQPFSEVAPGLFGGGLLKRTLAPLEQAAKSDLPIILQGETGTGKEVVARAIHSWSGRAGSMVAVNCAGA